MTEKPVPFYPLVSIARLSKLLVGLLIAGVVLAIVGIGSGLMERTVLAQVAAVQEGGTEGNTIDLEALVASAESSDTRQIVVGVIQTAVSIATIAIFLRWIYLSARNCHVVTGRKLQFSPGWSIGWYFIPIMNLWKPYQAMRQTWNVSENKIDAPERPAPGLLLAWWLLFLISDAIGRVSFKQAMRADEISELQTSNLTTILSDAVSIPSAIAAIFVVAGIARMQASNFVDGSEAAELH